MTEPRSIALVVQNPSADFEAALYGMYLDAQDSGYSAVYVVRPDQHEREQR